MGKNILGIFDGSDLEGVSALIDKLEESSFDYLKLEGDGVSLIIGKNGAGEAALQAISPAAGSIGSDGTGVNAANAVSSSNLVNTATSAAATSSASSTADASGTTVAVSTAVQAASSNDGALTQPQSKAAVPEQDGIFTIKSPSYGLFYSQSEPGAPPYVTVGAVIKKDDTIGLMEIMKTFTAITSPVAGEVVAIHINNEETLEPDMPLVSIRIQ